MYSSIENPETLSKIAYWYYKRNLTQSEIAKRLGTTRQKINQIIGSLVDRGIVIIHINGINEEFQRLEHLIEKHFNLKRVSVLYTNDYFNDAAKELYALFENNQIIGLSWGTTLAETVNAMQEAHLKKSVVVQLAGGMNSKSNLVRPDEIARKLSSKLSCDFQSLYAPAFVNSHKLIDEMLKEKSLQTSLDFMSKCDIAILGVGTLDSSSTTSKESVFSKEFLSMLTKEGCVGDIAMLPYKMNGEFVDVKNIITVSKEILKKIPNTIILAKGKEKATAVIGAINTKCINSLIIDSELAEQIVNQLELKGDI